MSYVSRIFALAVAYCCVANILAECQLDLICSLEDPVACAYRKGRILTADNVCLFYVLQCEYPDLLIIPCEDKDYYLGLTTPEPITTTPTVTTTQVTTSTTPSATIIIINCRLNLECESKHLQACGRSPDGTNYVLDNACILDYYKCLNPEIERVQCITFNRGPYKILVTLNIYENKIPPLATNAAVIISTNANSMKCHLDFDCESKHLPACGRPPNGTNFVLENACIFDYYKCVNPEIERVQCRIVYRGPYKILLTLNTYANNATTTPPTNASIIIRND